MDDILSVDEELSAVDVFGSKHSDSERQVKLMQRHQASRKRKLGSRNEYSIDAAKDALIECLCPNCAHVFYRKPDELNVNCPYCGLKHHFEEADEVHLTRQDEDAVTKLEKLAAKDKAQKRRAQYIVFRAADTHENDTHTQTSLDLGTAEYEEYVEDLQEHSPTKADDEFHKELETRNENLRPDMLEAVAAGDSTMNDYFERKAVSESEKRDLHDEIVAAVAVYASQTESSKDDVKISRVGIENPLLHDMGISVSDYEDAMLDFVK